MQDWLTAAIHALLAALALPQVGLGAVFIVALVSATLLPMGSEPAVYALVRWQPEMFWPTVGVATLGNTIGGGISWWMGLGAHKAADRWRGHQTEAGEPSDGPRQRQGRAEQRALDWLARFGPKACLLSWLPVVGDPLCAVAGWLRLPFWPCVLYMAVGKFGRYTVMTAALLWLI